jgi:hypothetical protein
MARLDPRSYSGPGRSSPGSAVMAGAFVIGIVWFVVGFFFFPPLLTVFGILLFGPFHAAFGIAFGIIFGFVQSIQIIATVAGFALTYPSAWSALSGVLAGCIVAWIFTTFAIKEKYSSPGISAIFSVDPIRLGGPTFFWLVIANAVAGYAVVVAFSSVGLFTPSASGFAPSAYGMEPVVQQLILTLHGGTGGGGDDVIFAFFALLVALIVAGAIVGAIIGAGLGSFAGAGLWVFDINHAIHGATQSATVNWLIGKREAKKERPSNLCGQWCRYGCG